MKDALDMVEDALMAALTVLLWVAIMAGMAGCIGAFIGIVIQAARYVAGVSL